MAPKLSKKEQAALALAERQAAAEEAFTKADVDGSGCVDADELKSLLKSLLRRERIEVEPAVVDEFVVKEFSEADTDGSGDVDFDEFIEYYNKLVDRLSGGDLNAAIANAKAEADKKAEQAAILEDDPVYVALHMLLMVLGAPSVRAYSGLNIPFKLSTKNAEATPNPEHGSTSRGLILDLSRRSQRLLTPWGSLAIGYRLAFPGYQEKVPSPEEEDKSPAGKAAAKAKRGATPWPLVPPNDGVVPAEPPQAPLFFAVAKMRLGSGALLVLRKLPNRCHFQVRPSRAPDAPNAHFAPTRPARPTRPLLRHGWTPALLRPAHDPPSALGRWSSFSACACPRAACASPARPTL